MVFLVIATAGLIDNWKTELSRWSTLRVSVLLKRSRLDPIDRLASYATSPCRVPEILLLSYTLLPSIVNQLVTLWFEAVVFDEIHTIKNDSTLAYKASRKFVAGSNCGALFGMTGTPIQNSLEDLFNILDLLVPGCLGTHRHFNEYYRRPLEASSVSTDTARERHQSRRDELQAIQRKYVLRRNKSVIADDLAGSTKTTVTMMCAMTRTQSMIYHAILESPDVRLIIDHVTRKKKQAFKPFVAGSATSRVPLLFDCIVGHHDGVSCDLCPLCLTLPVIRKLLQAAEHPSLLYPSPSDSPIVAARKRDYIRGLLDCSTGHNRCVLKEFRKKPNQL